MYACTYVHPPGLLIEARGSRFRGGGGRRGRKVRYAVRFPFGAAADSLKLLGQPLTRERRVSRAKQKDAQGSKPRWKGDRRFGTFLSANSD